MTTFQAIIYAIVQGFSEFLPVGPNAHRALVAYFLGWPEPGPALLGVLALGACLAVLIYFIHDWASMGSSVLQVIIFRKKPVSLDERLPMFILIALLPGAAAYAYLTPQLDRISWTPPLIAATLVGFGLVLRFAENFSRKNKNHYDWNWLDAIIAGLSQCAGLVMGCGRITGLLIGAFFRNYSREAALKFALYLSAPILAAKAYFGLREVTFSAPTPEYDLSWLSFYVAGVVAFFVSLLAIGGLMKHVQRKGLGQYVAWRLVLAAAALVAFWLRSG